MKLTRSENLPAVERLTDRSSLVIVVLAGVYFITAQLALNFITAKLALGSVESDANLVPIWPPAGIALAALLLRGNAVWPGILLGAFSAHLAATGSIFASLVVAGASTVEALVGAWFVRRFARGAESMDRTRDVLKFVALAGLLSTTISATAGILSLAWTEELEWTSLGLTWMVLWMGAATGVVLIAPMILLWKGSPRLNRRRLIEVFVLVLSVLAMGAMVFGGLGRAYPLEFFCIPFLVWAAFRFGRRGAMVSTLALAGIAIWGTVKGNGPFAAHGSFLLLQSFLGVCGVMTLALAAEVRQRRRAEREARSLAVSDAVTGLGNYRRLVDSLEWEIKRAERTRRAFAFVLFDLDDLKKINDIHGHLVGTRALCRFADILRLHSRSIDTVARYGGDEFAVILPETDRTGGSNVATRVASRLAADGEQPAVSVSFGVAMWPDDGRTTEELFHAADSALYEMKRGRGGVHAVV